MLQFVLGRAGSGKTEYIRSLIKEKLENGEKNLILLVPEQFSFESEKQILESVGSKKMMNLDVLSFTRLADSVIENTPYYSLPRIDDSGRAVLLRLAVDSLSDEIKIYRRYKSNFNGLSGLLSFIREMKQCSVTADELRSKSEVASGILKEKLNELSVIYESFDKKISEEFFDDDNLLCVANEKMISDGYFKNKTVILDAFTGFTSQELKVIGTVFSQAKDVYITLCTDSFEGYDEYSPFEFINATARKLLRLAKENSLDIKENIVLSNNRENRFKPDLKFLEENLYSDFNGKYDSYEKNIRVFAAESKLEECRFVSREIKRLMREENVRCRDIAVFEREKGTYDKYLSYMFKKYEIPFFEDNRVSVAANPLICTARIAVEIAEKGLDTDRILSILKTGMTDIDNEDIALIENYCFVWSLKGRDWKNEWKMNPEGFTSEMSVTDEQLLEKLNSLREKIVSPLLKLIKSFGSSSGKKKSEAVYNYLKDIAADKCLKKLAVFLNENGESALAAEQGAIWDELMRILDVLSSVSGDGVMSKKLYGELFSIIVSGKSVGTVPKGLDNVTVADAQRSRLTSPKYLFVLGLNEGSFPKDSPKNGVLTESERRTLISYGLEILPACDGRFSEERYIAYHAITSASDSLYLSYNTASSDSSSGCPSEVIERVLSLFKNVKTETKSAEISVEDIESEKCAFGSLASCWESDGFFSQKLKDYFASKEEYSGFYNALDRVASHKKYETNISDKSLAKKLFNKDMYISASRVERFYKCPFDYFCRYGMSVEPIQKAEIDNRISGIIIHYCLEQMIKTHGRAIAEMSEKQRKDEIKRILTEYAEENMGEVAGRTAKFDYNFKYHVDIISRLIDRLVEEFEFSDFVPVEFEMPIRDDAQIKPYEITASDGSKVYITGYIDRVDEMKKNGKNYVRIVDYKSGSKSFDIRDVYLGLNCQMLIYLFALWKNGKERFPSFVPSGILYFHANDKFVNVEKYMNDEKQREESLKSKTMKGIVLDDDDVLLGMDKNDTGLYIPAKTKNKSFKYSLEEFERFKNLVEQSVSDMAEKLHSGFIGIYPVEGKSDSYKDICEKCSYRSVCGIDELDSVRTASYGEVTADENGVE